MVVRSVDGSAIVRTWSLRVSSELGRIDSQSHADVQPRPELPLDLSPHGHATGSSGIRMRTRSNTMRSRWRWRYAALDSNHHMSDFSATYMGSSLVDNRGPRHALLESVCRPPARPPPPPPPPPPRAALLLHHHPLPPRHALWTQSLRPAAGRRSQPAARRARCHHGIDLQCRRVTISVVADQLAALGNGAADANCGGGNSSVVYEEHAKSVFSPGKELNV